MAVLTRFSLCDSEPSSGRSSRPRLAHRGRRDVGRRTRLRDRVARGRGLPSLAPREDASNHALAGSRGWRTLLGVRVVDARRRLRSCAAHRVAERCGAGRRVDSAGTASAVGCERLVVSPVIVRAVGRRRGDRDGVDRAGVQRGRCGRCRRRRGDRDGVDRAGVQRGRCGRCRDHGGARAQLADRVVAVRRVAEQDEVRGERDRRGGGEGEQRSGAARRMVTA